MKINNFRGDLSNISAKTATLHTFCHDGTPVMSYSIGDVSCSPPFLTDLTKRTASRYRNSVLKPSSISLFSTLLGLMCGWLSS